MNPEVAEVATAANYEPLYVLAAVVIAYYLGAFLAKQLRMKDHAWRLGLILASLALAGVVCSLRSPKFGIDLRGGVILIYEVDEEGTFNAARSQGAEVTRDEAASVDMPTLISTIKRRVDPSGVREVVIRPYGVRQVEVIIPEVSEAEIETIKKNIRDTGFLKFRIVANRDRDKETWDAGELALASDDKAVRNDKFVRIGDEIVGEWVAMARTELEDGEMGDYRMPTDGMLTRELVPGELEVLVVTDPFNVEGKHLRAVRSDFDDRARPSVAFDLSAEGSGLFGGLTGSNLPSGESKARLGIVMNEQLLSAPLINSQITNSGVIEGDFAQEEVDSLVRVLRAGKLPAVLHPDPISENQISALLGEDTIRKGTFAIKLSLAAVLVFMLLYYRFAGFVACLALAANLLFIVAAMILIRGAFTLPGLAGLILTVGMSVDANVLIFERIREELKKGSTLRMAIRNGFGRATTTIVDANLTTLITALVLYGIGTDQIKGFAVTLILGILMSMYTAIFCSRVIFDFAERKGWLTKLGMSAIVGETHIDFIGRRHAAAVVSLVCIAVGIGAVYLRGSNLFDIDFRGGTSVQVALIEPTPIEDIRSRVGGLADDVWVTAIQPADREKDTVFKIDTSIEDVEKLKSDVVGSLSSETGQSMLESHSMKFTPPVPVTLGQTSRRGTIADARQLLAFAQEANTQETAGAEAAATVPETAIDAGDSPQPSRPAGDEQQTTEDTESQPTADPGSTSAESAPVAAGIFRSWSELTFDEAISAQTLRGMVSSAAAAASVVEPRIELSNPDWNGRSDNAYESWQLQMTSEPAEAGQVLDALKTEMSETPVWLSASKIGSKVAGDMRTKAVAAILVSLLGIVGYIWIRFQRITFGLAAVVALVHDVLLTLGAVAISHWFAKFSGLLLIEDFKISLPIVAAFLTIIGYSLNDTIVVFDRIREVKGKNPKLTAEIINTSINQTLSRTLLTSLTTFLVVFILYAFGGEGIHGFAYALLIGVVVGTYSSVFVASPTLLWMTNWAEANAEKSRRKARATAAS